jgi:hypothetical protein
MTQITIDRALVEQGLEALDVAASCIDGYYVPRGKTTLPEIEKAQNALRAALAQQAEPDLSLCPSATAPPTMGMTAASRLTRTSARSAWPSCHNPLTT